MKQELKPFVLHEFSGTYREIGRQYGEECRDEIKAMIDWWYDKLSPIMPTKTLTDIVEASRQFEQPIKDYDPDLYDEIVGIAEGSGLELPYIIFHQGSFEMDVAGPLYVGGCTAFACSGKATKNNETIAGQHFDWYAGAEMVMMRVKPKNGRAFLGCSIAGQLVQFGIGESGIAHYANVLAYPKSIVGVPAVVVAQKVLGCKNVPDGIRCITQAANAIALNHLLAGPEGEIVDVEATPDKCGIILPDKDILTHSNHFLTHYLQQDDFGGQTSFPDTFLRQYRLKQLMEDQYGELTVDAMKGIMQDHRGYPDSICRQEDMAGPALERFQTDISMISLPAEGKIYASPCPCQAPYALYTL